MNGNRSAPQGDRHGGANAPRKPCAICGSVCGQGAHYKINDGLDHTQTVCGECYSRETGHSCVITGVGKETPITTNGSGGKQSASPYGFHLLPVRAVFAAASVAKYGAEKYGETRLNRNYTKIPADEHINHAIQHLYAYLAGDSSDSHQSHAIVRTMFAYEVDRLEGSDGKG